MGFLLDTAVTLIILLGQAAHWIVATLGKVLSLLMYVLGPIALAAAVPRGSDVGARWFHISLSILAWPLISSIIVGLTARYALQGLTVTSTYTAAATSIGFAGVLCVTSFAVPLVATSLIGGGFQAVGAGWAALGAAAGAVTGGASTVASGAMAVAGTERPEWERAPERGRLGVQPASTWPAFSAIWPDWPGRAEARQHVARTLALRLPTLREVESWQETGASTSLRRTRLWPMEREVGAEVPRRALGTPRWRRRGHLTWPASPPAPTSCQRALTHPRLSLG